MTGRVLPPDPVIRDDHTLPSINGNDLGTLAECDVCGRWFVLKYISDDWVGYRAWRPVRFWHWRRKRRLRRAGFIEPRLTSHHDSLLKAINKRDKLEAALADKKRIIAELNDQLREPAGFRAIGTIEPAYDVHTLPGTTCRMCKGPLLIDHHLTCPGRTTTT